MRIALASAGLAVALAASACSQDGPGPLGALAGGWQVPVCDEVPRTFAPERFYDGVPSYGPHENPDVIEEAVAWAQGRPGYQDVWIDRERGSRVSLAFSEDAEANHAAARERFPDAGVVVVPVDWELADLRALQAEVIDALRERQISSGVDITRGVVTLDFRFLTDENRRAADTLFADRPVCVSGGDPDAAPDPGPQLPQGEGWSLLGDAPTGLAHHTAFAGTSEAFAELWQQTGLGGELPEVDFSTHAVIWFGVAVSGSCPDVRLDEVVFDLDRQLVHPTVVNLTEATACTSDANPHAFVVVVERGRLPAAPFDVVLAPEGNDVMRAATSVTAADLG